MCLEKMLDEANAEIARLEVCCKVKDEELDVLRKREDQLMAEVVEAKDALQKKWHAWEDDIKRMKGQLAEHEKQAQQAHGEIQQLRQELSLTMIRNSALQDLFVRVQRSLSKGTPAGKLSAQLQAMLQQVDWHGPEGDILRFAIERMESLEDLGPEKAQPRLPDPENMHGACDGFGGSDFDDTWKTR